MRMFLPIDPGSRLSALIGVLGVVLPDGSEIKFLVTGAKREERGVTLEVERL